MLRHLVHLLASRGKAVLYSSHVLEVVEKLCTRVIVLHRGRIVAEDTVDQLRTLMSHESLEQVFAQLVLETNPAQTAQRDRGRGGRAMRERLLTRHFLQRFLENDLVSPDSDRHDVLSLVGRRTPVRARCSSPSRLALKFMFMPLQSPGRTAILAVDDRLLFLTCAMIVMALVAVTAPGTRCRWIPATRRSSGPLPIAHGVIVRAKLRAVALFAGFRARGDGDAGAPASAADGRPSCRSGCSPACC